MTQVNAVSDFNVISVQSSVFTAGTAFSPSKAIKQLLNNSGDKLTGDPITLPHAEGLPPEIPRIILQSEDGSLKVQVGPTRVDILLGIKAIGEALDQTLSEHLDWSGALLSNYGQAAGVRVVRLACVLTRCSPDSKPPQTLARHFCRSPWGDRLSDTFTEIEFRFFEKFSLNENIHVNMLSKFRTATSVQDGKPTSPDPNILVVEQDIHTPPDRVGQFGPESIKAFFPLAHNSLDEKLPIYLQEGGSQ
jgi:hypothetical protein